MHAYLIFCEGKEPIYYRKLIIYHELDIRIPNQQYEQTRTNDIEADINNYSLVTS